MRWNDRTMHRLKQQSQSLRNSKKLEQDLRMIRQLQRLVLLNGANTAEMIAGRLAALGRYAESSEYYHKMAEWRQKIEELDGGEA